MNGAHVHLIFNHIPVIGVLFGLAFLIVGIFRRREIIIKSALWIFLAVAILSVPTFLIYTHEEAAEKAFIASIVLGLLALTGLAGYRIKSGVPRFFLVVVVAASLLVAALMAWTANLGGEIRHPEIRSGAPPLDQPAPAGTAVEHDS